MPTPLLTRDELLRRLKANAPSIPEPVVDVVRRLQQRGHQAVLAGGCVRDLLLGRPSDDFDVATSARPELVMQAFPHVVPTGLQHGTVLVVLGEGPHEKVEVTTFRGESEYVDGRRPSSVHFHEDLHADLARRDFTVNAIAYDPVRGALHDPFDGVGDLSLRLLRAVGDPLERFSEDGLRALRAVRLASVLRFRVDRPTLNAVGQTRDTFRKVALERVRDELQKLLLKSPRPSRGLRLLASTGLLEDVAPEMLPMRGHPQNRWHRWDVWEHTLRVVDAAPPKLVVRLAALLHDVSKPACAQPSSAPGEYSFHGHENVGAKVSRAMLERLRFPTKVIEAVAHLVREHNWHYSPDWTDGAVRRAIARVGVDALEDYFELREADILGHGRNREESLRNLAELRARIEAERARASALSIRDLAVNGNDLMKELGRRPGTWVGETLRALLQHVLDRPEDNQRERLLELARELTSE